MHTQGSEAIDEHDGVWIRCILWAQQIVAWIGLFHGYVHSPDNTTHALETA
jgi:hypothetical protein